MFVVENCMEEFLCTVQSKCQFVGLCRSVNEVSLLLGYDAASFGILFHKF
jgi:hypothetical protein